MLRRTPPTAIGALLAVVLAGPGVADTTTVPSSASPIPLQEVLLEASAIGHLPLRFALETLPSLRVRVHQVEGFPPSRYAQRPIPLLEADSRSTSPWPDETPTLYLHGPSYLRNGSWIPLVDQTVDVSEHLFNALLLAHLELRERGRDSPYNASMQRRADEFLQAVPAEHRLEAYIHAVADFGSHALSAANQLERSARRHRRLGTDLCRHLDRRASLFGLWDGIFGEAFYQARYFEPAQGDALVGRWVDTGIGIEKEDKRLFLHSVFLDFWEGDRRKDLGSRHCPPDH